MYIIECSIPASRSRHTPIVSRHDAVCHRGTRGGPHYTNTLYWYDTNIILYHQTMHTLIDRAIGGGSRYCVLISCLDPRIIYSGILSDPKERGEHRDEMPLSRRCAWPEEAEARGILSITWADSIYILCDERFDPLQAQCETVYVYRMNGEEW